MQEKLKEAIKKACRELFDADVEPELSRPDEKFGDYSSNVAMQLGGNPRAAAERLAGYLKKVDGVADAELAGPGFINIRLDDKSLLDGAFSAADLPEAMSGQEVVAEYSDPNPFKVLHAGHLYTSVVGDAIANLCAAAGANVHRVNFGGDVGLHVAKAMWGILKDLGGQKPEKLGSAAPHDFADWVSKMYVAGNQAYESDEAAKAEIREINQRLYKITTDKDKTSPLAQIYWTTRGWSYDYFDEFYKMIGSGFEKYYPESEAVEPGMKAVKAHIGQVFKESEGAIVFKGEVHNLHTRVFINAQGLPTYETKDVGLILSKWRDYQFDKSIVITANDINEYMQVVLKAVEQFEPELVKKTIHKTHGLIKLAGGAKMSSRKGNVVRAIDVLQEAKNAARKINAGAAESVSLGAVKYAFLKQRLGGDIVYDPQESVSLEGNSGPYLQYAHARARSILAKAASDTKAAGSLAHKGEMMADERSLARKINEYPEVVAKATYELMPHHICTYLYELAQVFNRFYEKSRVIGSGDKEELRVALVRAYADVLKHGLNLLSIEAPEKI